MNVNVHRGGGGKAGSGMFLFSKEYFVYFTLRKPLGAFLAPKLVHPIKSIGIFLFELVPFQQIISCLF
jgi:hypothetical protein